MLRAVAFDVLVVLGCRVGSGQLSHAALRRVNQAAQTYRETGAALVIACGGKAWQGRKECQAFAEALVERGVPAERIVQEQESLTTRGNARGVAKLLRDKPAQSLAVVTCDWHMPRALRIFRSLGMSPIAVPAPAPTRPLHSVGARFLRERAGTILDWLFAPFLLVCLLCACQKPSEQLTSRAMSAAPSASLAPATLGALLQAELRRDPTAVPEDELIAERTEARVAAVRALARIQDPRSFELLSKALADEATPVMGWAAFGVGQLCRGHEPEAVRHLALRAASLAAAPRSEAGDQALGAIALALGRCASDEAEKTLRTWLKLRAPIADAAALALLQVARKRKHLDEASVAALLDAAAKTPSGSALYPIESLPALGGAARERLLEVAKIALDQAGPGRAFAVRALGKAGPEAAAPLRRLFDSENATDAELADAARSLGALGSAAQAELSGALAQRARSLIDAKAWLTTQHGLVLTLLDSMDPKGADPKILAELAQLPLQGEPAPIARRKVMLRCRAAALLANRSSGNPELLGCDPAPAAERREGKLALIKVLGRGPLGKERGPRFAELARSPDRVVREAALELLTAHDEAPGIPELLASALSANEAGVRATAAKILARYPARAKNEPKDGADPKVAPPTDAGVVQALTKQLAEIGTTNNIELAGWLLDAAVALELLGAKPALERACGSPNPTLRQHAESGFAAFGDAKHACPSVAGTETWTTTLGATRLDFDTDVGPLSITLKSDESPFASARFVELVRAGFYDGMLIHRVVPGFVVQFGDPDGDGFGGPSLPPLRDQLGSEPFDLHSVGVALAGRDTGISQFFVTLRRTPHLDGEYSLVGTAEPGWERLAEGDRILKARVLEAGAK